MYYVYVIQSKKYAQQFYTGYTADLAARIRRHNSSSTKHTKKYIPWRLVFYIAFNERQKALEFEKYLKSASGVAFRNKRFVGKK